MGSEPWWDATHAEAPVRHYSQKLLASPVADSADMSPAPVVRSRLAGFANAPILWIYFCVARVA
jgi:hypothetical protein